MLDLVEESTPARGPRPVDVLAAAATAELDVPALEVGTAPPRRGTSLVGVDVWFWAIGARTTSATAAIPGLSATATARPVGLTVSIDGHVAVRCDDPGTPYGAAPTSGRQPCTTTIDRPGARHIEVALRWAIAWQASDGSGGRLPATTRRSSFDLQVAEGRGLTD